MQARKQSVLKLREVSRDGEDDNDDAGAEIGEDYSGFGFGAMGTEGGGGASAGASDEGNAGKVRVVGSRQATKVEPGPGAAGVIGR